MRKSDFSDIKDLSKETLLQSADGARLAERVKEYIAYKSRLIKRLTLTLSMSFLILFVYLVAACGNALHESHAVIFWTVIGVLAAAVAGSLTAVVVNMAGFNKFLKRFE